MRIYEDISLRNFKFWSGAVDTAEKLTEEQLDRVETTLEELYPEGVSDTFINDLFWFEEKTVFEWAGYDPIGDMGLEDQVSSTVVRDIAEYINESFEHAIALSALAIFNQEKVGQIKTEFEIEDGELHHYSYNLDDYIIGATNDIHDVLTYAVNSDEFKELYEEACSNGNVDYSIDEWKDRVLDQDCVESIERIFGVDSMAKYNIAEQTVYVFKINNWVL